MIYSTSRHLRRYGCNAIHFGVPRSATTGVANARRVYRALRRAGHDAWFARELVWRLAFDARIGTFVPGSMAVA